MQRHKRAPIPSLRFGCLLRSWHELLPCRIHLLGRQLLGRGARLADAVAEPLDRRVELRDRLRLARLRVEVVELQAAVPVGDPGERRDLVRTS